MLLPLQPPHDAPTPVPVCQGESDGLGSVLRHAIMIVLSQCRQIRARPAETTLDRQGLQVQVDRHRGAMAIPLKAQAGTGHHQEHKIFRKPWVHLAQLSEVDLHKAQSSSFLQEKATPIREPSQTRTMQIED